jgi:hypothetical protein
LVSPTSETLAAARLGWCPKEWASRVGSRPLERLGPAARAPEGCHISRRAAAAAWPVHLKGRPSARRSQLERSARRRGRPARPGREAEGPRGGTVQKRLDRSRRARRAAERPSTFSYRVAVTRQLAAVGRVILTWRARPARPSTRGALLLRDYARARPARPAHEREAALSGSRARPARPAHEREASLPPMAVTPEQGRQDRPMRGGASSPSSAPEQGRQGRRCEEWASV